MRHSFFYSRGDNHNTRKNKIREIKKHKWNTRERPKKTSEKKKQSSQGLTNGIPWKKGYTNGQNNIRKTGTENIFR